MQFATAPNEPNWTCNFCNVQLSSKQSVEYHIKRFHQNEIQALTGALTKTNCREQNVPPKANQSHTGAPAVDDDNMNIINSCIQKMIENAAAKLETEKQMAMTALQATISQL